MKKYNSTADVADNTDGKRGIKASIGIDVGSFRAAMRGEENPAKHGITLEALMPGLIALSVARFHTMDCWFSSPSEVSA